jgi:hypothetical protein
MQQETSENEKTLVVGREEICEKNSLVGGNRAVASGRGFGNITARSRMGRTGEAI